MSDIVLENIHKSFSPKEKIINGLNLRIKEGEFIVLLGPSGCGKTTLLRLIAGLHHCDEGKISIDNKDATNIPSSKRGLAMVFQSYALYPHMSVRGNIEFGLRLAKLPKEERNKRIESVAKVLEITQLLDRKPRALSGGQRQRVAIGRAIARNPVAFLFDEPLSNLDAALRAQMRLEIARLHNRLKKTMIYVTHDQMEAMTLADKIVVMNKGNIEQIGKAMELYHRPVNRFVAEFIGSPKMNIFKAQKVGKSNKEAFLTDNIKVLIKRQLINGTIDAWGVRPEHIKDVAIGKGDCKGQIEVIEQLGDNSYLYVEIAGLGLINMRVEADNEYKVGDEIGIAFMHEHSHLFAADGKSLVAYK